MLGKTGLKQMSLSSFFPNQQYPFCQCTPDDPYSYIKKIDDWRVSNKPSRFIISGTPINYAVSIENFKWGEQDGTGDVYFTLDFKEYKFIGGVVDSTQVNEVTGMKERADSSFTENALTNVTVYPGDSIGDIIGRAVGRTTNLGENDQNVLAAYKKVAKSGGIQTGDIVTYAATNNILKVNGKIV
ncbi:hypothetical protein [Anaerosinus massiliensis]|uniref:hypothetical protein n=1 Tax=Massilibacillus massiliensis TaxID=1806837 RepID=UPI000DA6292A|nr:hypothetical protein [Massilibacillus massiliensis]